MLLYSQLSQSKQKERRERGRASTKHAVGDAAFTYSLLTFVKRVLPCYHRVQGVAHHNNGRPRLDCFHISGRKPGPSPGARSYCSRKNGVAPRTRQGQGSARAVATQLAAALPLPRSECCMHTRNRDAPRGGQRR